MNTVSVGHIYNHADQPMMATSENELTPLRDLEHVGPYTPNSRTTLSSMVGFSSWTVHMIDAVKNYRDRVVELEKMVGEARHDQNVAQKELHAQKTVYRQLGEALLEEANKRNWCSQYNDFADTWNLPKRTLNFRARVEFNFCASSRDEAKILLRDSLDNLPDELVEVRPEVEYVDEV